MYLYIKKAFLNNATNSWDDMILNKENCEREKYISVS